MTTFPCMSPKLVPVEKVRANEYNPNKVASTEYDLLRQSIEADGVTMPIVTYYDPSTDKYIVVDGFHRYTILRDIFKCKEVPIVTIDKNIKERMASTVRHNRARGKHQVDLMAELVKRLIREGCADEEIAERLGMTDDELVRLKQVVGIAKLFSAPEYSKAWGEDEDDS
jgi:ParB-like chromosome segregation protein Spo0J